MFPDQAKIEKNNKRLERMYTFIERNLPGMVIPIQIKNDYISDSNHKWGLSPFYYENQYYEQFAIELKKIIV